jgi:RNA polymerase sigma-70 factor (ECF subfamily)
MSASGSVGKDLVGKDLARRRFSAVVLPHLDHAYSFAKALARNGADAEDIVQDACVRALAALETREVEHPRAWLLTIVRNVALTHLARKNNARAEAVGDLEQEDALSAVEPAPNAEAQLIAADESATLRRAFAGLPLALRETLALRVVHGLSYREISAATDAPIGTVMSRLARARSTLAALLGEDK